MTRADERRIGRGELRKALAWQQVMHMPLLADKLKCANKDYSEHGLREGRMVATQHVWKQKRARVNG